MKDILMFTYGFVLGITPLFCQWYIEGKEKKKREEGSNGRNE